jgi:serine/threonine protein kinase
VFLVRPLLAPQDAVYAMKVLRKAEVVKRHQVEHTLTERSILANTTHPFILALRYAFQSEHKLYMVSLVTVGAVLHYGLVWMMYHL